MNLFTRQAPFSVEPRRQFTSVSTSARSRTPFASFGGWLPSQEHARGMYNQFPLLNFLLATNMTIWTASVGDILNASADALICSANPQLNLSGGVGGAFGLRYGASMQQFLHSWLVQNGRRFVAPGEIVVAPSLGSSFKVVVHAVAVDAFYDTSADIISEAYKRSFAALSDAHCRTVATSCLACGYGRASPQMFINAVRPLLTRNISGIDRVEFISTDSDLIEALQNAISARTDV